MLSAIILAASVFATMTSAQTISIKSTSGVVATTTIAQAMPPSATSGFDASQVNSTVRSTWCRAELNTCPQICGGYYSRNECIESTLTYTCVCANGTVPDVTAFSQTLPFYICQETFIQCNAAHPNDLAGQQQCAANEQCGTRNATAELLASSSAASSSTARSTSSAASGSSTGSSSASATSASATSASATSASATSASATHNAAAFSAEMTTGAFIAAVLAAFKLLL